MRTLLVIGAGTAGVITVNKLRKKLPRSEWAITVVDPAETHDYQPGYLFLSVGMYTPKKVGKPLAALIPKGVTLVKAAVQDIKPADNKVVLTDGTTLDYDYLVIATGTTPRPDQIPGMDGELWHDSVQSFYTFADASALFEKLEAFEGGKVVVHVTEMPIKCPVAPLEFAFLAEDYFNKRGIRDKVELTYVTPLPGAFTKPVAAKALGDMLGERSIAVEPDFIIERVDEQAKAIVSYDEREIPFDLLVTVPLNMGADFVGRAGLGDELNFVTVDKGTLLSTKFDNVFALGDATNAPTSKAGAVAHYELDLFPKNFLQHIAGKEMTHKFDGHATCFVESGRGKALLLDFNYDVEPLQGSFPIPVIGPMRLLKETRLNHLGKLVFRFAYWWLLLPGRYLPISPYMSMRGKRRPAGN
jgi:sulfide:quinone oxidoreductase